MLSSDIHMGVMVCTLLHSYLHANMRKSLSVFIENYFFHTAFLIIVSPLQFLQDPPSGANQFHTFSPNSKKYNLKKTKKHTTHKNIRSEMLI